MVHHRKFYFLICKRIVERKTAKRDIILTNSNLVCLCKDDIYWGIPCRHQAVMVSNPPSKRLKKNGGLGGLMAIWRGLKKVLKLNGLP